VNYNIIITITNNNNNKHRNIVNLNAYVQEILDL